jgi:hypothetical protein
MANAFEGASDERQSDEVIETSRFRPRYRTLTDDELVLHDEIKTKASELEALFNEVKPGRYSSLAMTSLEQAVMWSIKELTT